MTLVAMLQSIFSLESAQWWWEHGLTPKEAAHERYSGTRGQALTRKVRVDWALEWIDETLWDSRHPMHHWPPEDYALFLGEYMRLVYAQHGGLPQRVRRFAFLKRP